MKGDYQDSLGCVSMVVLGFVVMAIIAAIVAFGVK
jgi:hypothetical protein